MANIRSFKELRVWQNAMDNDAEGEAAETQTWIEFARRCGCISDQQADEYEQVLGQLVTMIENPDDWVIGAGLRTTR